MRRPPCPRCRGSLFFTAEDGMPRYTCLLCGRSFAPAREAQPVARAA